LVTMDVHATWLTTAQQQLMRDDGSCDLLQEQCAAAR